MLNRLCRSVLQWEHSGSTAVAMACTDSRVTMKYAKEHSQLLGFTGFAVVYGLGPMMHSSTGALL